MATTLIATQDLDIAKDLMAHLEETTWNPVHVADCASALECLSKSGFDLIVADMALPDFNESGFLKKVIEKQPDCKFIAISSSSEASSAVSVIRSGAFDYLTLPLEKKDIDICLERVAAHGFTSSRSGPGNGYPEIIGESDAIKEVFRMIEKLADTNSTIMLSGESGTGKELVARAIHMSGSRRNNPMIPVNCGAIPEELLESELFGHEKGAFTNAIRSRAGRFELADQGTIFLDEIAEMSPKLQVKLLRVLQERQFERIGGNKLIKVDIRVVAATNKNLEERVENGEFREDLFYRLNVIPISIPPLRDRKSDIPLLLDHFLKKFNLSKQKKITGINEEARALLMSYGWPGNIRELENIVERVVILADNDFIGLEDIPTFIRKKAGETKAASFEIPEEGIDFNQMVSNYEDQLLRKALEKTGWVKNKAAKLLNLNRTTLVEKLKKKNIEPES